MCSKITDIFIAINQEDYFREKLWNTYRVEYVPGIGMDIDVFQNEVIDRVNLRSEFGFSERDFVFMSTGLLSKKNHGAIARSLARIKDERVKYHDISRVARYCSKVYYGLFE